MSNEREKDERQFINKPIQLIKFEGPRLLLDEEAMKFLRSIKEEIIVISVVGKARTGKSFLMNTLLELNGKSEGVRKFIKLF